MTSTYHNPVLLHECITHLNIRPNGIYVDGTLGGGGHTEAILKQNSSCKVLAFDVDQDAIKSAQERLLPFASRIIIEQANFRQLRQILDVHKISAINGLLLDLGVSSFQLDHSQKGFSYRFDAPLKMQMNDRESFSARDVVNEYDEEQLADIFFHLGEEKHSRRIARAITKSRTQQPIETTTQLARVIMNIIPERFAKKTLSRIFQAIRIQVNDELNNLRQTLNDALEIIDYGGRLAVISYHSLEDRIVKDFYRNEASDKIYDPNYPELSQSKQPRLEIVTRKPIVSAENEVHENPRARSAKLRVAVRI
ncbi:16S rRNA (cytosine(1402)-N(4))-methyltransferase RsmH [bacterium]|nr:16S rRNA (cytosine(1402)-N(4))-methyltransferase RsmH [bacterium]